MLDEISNSDEEYMVVGGASINKIFLKYVDTMYLTTIYDSNPKEADCYFPEFNPDDWDIKPLIEGQDKDITYKTRKYHRKSDEIR